MKITKELITKWFEDLSTLFLSSLNNQLIFEKKLESVKFLCYETNEVTHGLMEGIDKKVFNISIWYNPTEDKKFIQFTIAHELTHLLFSVPNILGISGYCSTDNSFSVTSVTREIEAKQYGNKTEELLCDYFAIELVYRYNNNEGTREDLTKTLYSKVFNKFTEENYYMIKKIVNLFGDDISNLEKFDDFNSEDGYSPKNLLLYGAITNTLNLLVNDYDDCMGKNSWRRLNMYLTDFVCYNSDKDIKNAIDIEINRFKLIDSE